jgi:phospholipid/cholesterol/gamma-HCH transport system ATP-binding protein
MTAQVILHARGIVNRFGAQQVHDGVELDVKRGEIIGIAGGSGAGKSVLLKTLAGLHRPNAGEVLIDETPVGAIGPVRKAQLLGMLFQQGALFSSLTVAQNIMLPLREHTRLSEPAQRRVAAMKLELAGLPAICGVKFPSELSGGMVKRAALARALALDPRMLFLDEPTGNLDPLTASGIDALIVQLNRSLGISFVIVTHDLMTLTQVCHRVAALVERKLIVGTVATLQRSKDPRVREVLHDPRSR